MVQLVPVYLCCFGNADREGMLARRDICQKKNLFRHHIRTRTPVGT